MNQLLEIGLTNAALATLVAVFATLAGRLVRRPALAHALWLLVLLKLVTPPFVLVPVTLPKAAVRTEVAAVSLGSVPLVATSAAPETAPPSLEPVPVHPAGEALPSNQTSAGTDVSGVGGDNPAPAAVARPISGLDAAWITPAVLTAWLAGSLICLTLTCRRMLAFHRLLRHARRAPSRLQEDAQRLSERLGLARCPAVWLVPGALSPLVWALAGRARLVLPAPLLERLGPEQRETLLAHELAHVLRRDHWVRWLELVTVCLYWWHPVAWWARGRIQHFEEECCDAWVVQTLPAAARAYARALVETVNFLADARPALPPAASGLGYVHSLRRRLHMILREPLTHRLAWPSRLAAIFLGLLILPIAPQRLAAARAPDDDDLPATRPADGEDAPASSRDSNMERRMRSLELKLDRLTRVLEERARRTRTQGGEAAQEDLKSADEQKRQAADEKRRAEDERRRAADERRRAGEEKRRARDTARETARHASRDHGGAPAEGDQLKDLDRRIQEAINRAVSPERMRDLDRHIQEAINRSINPKRMEAMAREIERTVNQAVSPERMEALSRQIEAAVHHAMAAQDRVRSAAERAHSAADQQHVRAIRAAAAQGSRGAGPGQSSSGRPDLERRMDRLEQRLDRVMQGLESPDRRSPK